MGGTWELKRVWLETCLGRWSRSFPGHGEEGSSRKAKAKERCRRAAVLEGEGMSWGKVGRKGVMEGDSSQEGPWTPAVGLTGR